MYIPKFNLATDTNELVGFMKRFSFATIICSKDDFPIATHLPFLVGKRDEKVILTSHFAKANNQWADLETAKVLVIFTEPHAYVSTRNYDKELNVPTWNYISVHAYGKGTLITDPQLALHVINSTVDHFEAEYRPKWDSFPSDYKTKMLNGIVAFEIEVTDLQGKKKLSQNRSETEKDNIIENLSNSEIDNERLIADYMLKDRHK